MNGACPKPLLLISVGLHPTMKVHRHRLHLLIFAFQAELLSFTTKQSNQTKVALRDFTFGSSLRIKEVFSNSLRSNMKSLYFLSASLITGSL